MTSQIIFSTIDTTYPIPGRDNDSQGFRNNFSVVKAGLEIAHDEISLLQANKADLIIQSSFTNETDSESTTTGAMTVLGGVGVGKNLNVGGAITSGGASVSTTATSAFSLINSDLISSGTLGQPTLKIKPVVYGNRAFTTGTVTIGALTNLDPTYILYVNTTGTSQTAITGYAHNSQATALQLIISTDTGAGGYKWQKFVKYDGAAFNIVGDISLDNDGTTDFVVFGSSSADTKFKFEGGKFVVESAPPTTAGDAGRPGMITWDAGYIYVCVAEDTWKRAALTTWA